MHGSVILFSKTRCSPLHGIDMSEIFKQLSAQELNLSKELLCPPFSEIRREFNLLKNFLSS